MNKSLFASLAAATLIASPSVAADPDNTFGAHSAQVEADVRFLADDLLEGREAGTRGHEIAAAYVVSRFSALGLQPGGAGGSWYQQVKLRKATLDADKSSVALVRNGERKELSNDLAMARPSLSDSEALLDAPMVFVGNGLDAPELGLNSYEGIDAQGKIVVYLSSLPPGLSADILGHVDQSRKQMAADRGAVGAITISAAPEAQALQYYRFVTNNPVTSWIAPDGRNGFLPVGLMMTINASPDGAAALFDGAPVALPQLLSMARNGDDLPSFDLSGRMEATAISTFEDVTTPNVIGILPGSDPEQAGEYVLLVSHLDHLGYKKNAKPGEDNINNGALDNASGIATMLEAARMFVESDNQPDRSIIFMAVTAEEKGLLGSEYYAAMPTVPMNDIVANISLDMPVPLYDFTDVVAFGAEHSSVSDYIRDAAATMDVTLSPDPMPEQGIFVRSDHYSFAKEGVPSVLLFTGYANGGEAIWADFFANRYHKVGDDLSQDFHWNALARYAALNYRIASAIAEDDARPLWYEGNFFGNSFDPDGERAPAP